MTPGNRPLTIWIALGLAIFSSAVAAFLALVPPPSECGMPIAQHIALPTLFFTLYLMTGACVLWSGSRFQRLLLFGASGLVLAAYFCCMSLILPMLLDAAVQCARHG